MKVIVECPRCKREIVTEKPKFFQCRSCHKFYPIEHYLVNPQDIDKIERLNSHGDKTRIIIRHKDPGIEPQLTARIID